MWWECPECKRQRQVKDSVPRVVCACGFADTSPADRQIAEPPSRGLGDTIAKVTSALGIKPCGGCTERQETLNRLVPYKSS